MMSHFFTVLFILVQFLLVSVSAVYASKKSPVALVGDSTIRVKPGDPIHLLVGRASSGTTFIFSPGIHRIQLVQPKDAQSFIGEEGAILSGAEQLRGFVEDGNRWMLTGQRKRGGSHGICAKNADKTESSACQYSQELFIDGTLVEPAQNLASLQPGKWYFDLENERIYIADSPMGHTFELSVTTAAFVGSSQGVVIRGLTIEKFANPAQFGAIHNYSTPVQIGKGWVIEQNNIQLNHGTGIRADEEALVRKNYIHHNGQLGINAQGRSAIIEENEIAYNNTRRFDYYWEAGGTKFVRTVDMIVRQNYVHHNSGPGLWTDGYNSGVRYEDNVVEDNQGPGIFHEISYSAIITNNTVKRNGFSWGWYMGAGILIAASSDTEVRGNRVFDNANGIIAMQQDRGSGPQGVHQVKNVYVHDNRVAMAAGATGLGFDPKYTGVRSANGNRFDANIYELGKQTQPFVWLGKAMTKEEWVRQGQDKTGQFLPHP